MERLNWYKKIINSTETRLKILKLLSFVPTKTMLKIQYRIKFKRKLNLKNPQRYTDKMQKYKINYRNGKMIQCADKFDVREYVKGKGLEDILVKNYGVYSNINDINFSILPKSFVLKSTNGGGAREVILVEDKEELDKLTLMHQTKGWTRRTSKRHGGREYSYHGTKGRIIVEELLKSAHTGFERIEDYKFFCFNGRVEFVKLVFKRKDYVEGNIYDRDWNHLHIESDDKCSEDDIKKPKNFTKMIEIAEILSQDFPHVRVDLYNIHGKIYFGEMTFYPWSGYIKFEPDDFDFTLGKKFSYY